MLLKFPVEILIQIYENLQLRDALGLSVTNKSLNSILKNCSPRIRIDIKLVLDDFRSMGVKFKAGLVMVELPISTLDDHLGYELIVHRLLEELAPTWMVFRLVKQIFVDGHRSESNYNLVVDDPVLYLSIQRYTKGFRTIQIRHPSKYCTQIVTKDTKRLELLRVHRSVELDNLDGIDSIFLESDGRFLTQESTFSYESLGKLENSTRLKSIILDGPWLEIMVTHPRYVIDKFKNIKTLETLVIDLDMFKLTPEVIYNLINELPNLKRFGRPGRVDKRFWRMFKKFSCTKIQHLELGTIKVPTTHKMDPNPGFLKDLAFGVLWAFPNLVTIKVYIGFQGGPDTEIFLEIIKQLKEGLPIVYKEYEASVMPDPNIRKLRSVELYQVSDVLLLQQTRWNYVATKHAGGPPITIFVTDDSSATGSLGRSYRYFPDLNP